MKLEPVVSSPHYNNCFRREHQHTLLKSVGEIWLGNTIFAWCQSISKWEDFNIVKMLIIFKLIYRFNANFVKISAGILLKI